MSGAGRAVLLTPVRPARSGNGLAMRAGVIAEGLAREHELHVVVAPVMDVGPADDLLESLGATTTVLSLELPADPRAEAVGMLSTGEGRERAAQLAPRPSLSGGLTAAAAAHVAELARGAALVWTFRLYLAPLLDALLDAPQRPRLVTDVDDLDAVVQRQLGDADEAAAYERLERYYLPRTELVTAAAAADADVLGERHAIDAVVLPNAVRPPAALADLPIEHDLLFVGNLSYAPNVEAACWLARELGPRLGSPRIAIAGSRPAPEVRALDAVDGVTVIGDVADIADCYARAALAVAPLATGGGTRIKILEALAHARAVVATPRGAEGIPFSEEDGVIVSDRDDFAQACAGLLADPARRKALGQAGRDAVSRTASADVVCGHVAGLARDILVA